jgi:hypothetical protein
MSRSASFRFDCRLTGLFYLGLAITGALGFMTVRPELFVPGDPAQTLANLQARTNLARIGVALELGTAMFQALAAVWFGRLFRETDAFAAGALSLLGMVNAIVVLSSAALLGASVDAALGSTGAEPTTSHLLMLTSEHFWRVGNIFFGLWLFPMGWLVWKAQFGHRVLGWILIFGAFGYVLNGFVTVFVPNAGPLGVILPTLAAVGEFWMIGLLLWTGLRATRSITGGSSR